MENDPRRRVIQVTTTAGSRGEAERLGLCMVQRRLAACAQVQGPINSTYRWKGEIQTAEEWVLLLKTTQAHKGELIGAIRAEHSYETPDIVVVEISDGLDSYLAWIAEETGPEAEKSA
ncbi:MAG: divalent-cation tolerance protein CutA [Candidatus Dormibacteraeota bacterium]|nr:divalent-cation tolerance protein CutA [Candidatus Dormibacteraeota bacterium]